MIKFLVDHSDLLKGLNRVASALPTRSSLPYLTNVLLETDGDSLELAATDLDTTVVTRLPASVSTPGAVLLPGKKLHEIVRELPESEVRFSGTGNRITISCGKGSFTLSGSSKEQFPTLPTEGGTEPVVIPVDVLVRAIKVTSYAVAKDDYRATLNGALMKTGAEGFEMVATDGHRLSRVLVPDLVSPVELKALVTQKALNLFARFSGEGDVLIRHEGSQISFQFDGTKIYSRTIDGEYPPYKKVIPKDNDCDLELDREELILVLRRVNTMANPSTHQVMFSLESGKVMVHAESSDAGEAREELQAEYHGRPFQIGFNCSFLMEILRNMDCERVKLQMKDSGTAVLIRDAKDPGDGWRHLALIMPVKLSRTQET